MARGERALRILRLLSKRVDVFETDEREEGEKTCCGNTGPVAEVGRRCDFAQTAYEMIISKCRADDDGNQTTDLDESQNAGECHRFANAPGGDRAHRKDDRSQDHRMRQVN